MAVYHIRSFPLSTANLKRPTTNLSKDKSDCIIIEPIAQNNNLASAFLQYNIDVYCLSHAVVQFSRVPLFKTTDLIVTE
jgi:hypothetical protein